MLARPLVHGTTNYIYGFLEITYYTGVAAPSRVLVQSHRGRAKIKKVKADRVACSPPHCVWAKIAGEPLPTALEK